MPDDYRSDEVYGRTGTQEFPGLSDIPENLHPEGVAYLGELIESFNRSTVRLKEAYSSLQKKFDAINLKLEETNRELSESLDEKERLSNYLTNILGSLSSGVLAVDRYGVITLFNKGAENLTGFAEEEAVGRQYGDIMGLGQNESNNLLSNVHMGSNRQHAEKIILSRGGRRIPVGYSVSPLVDGGGEVNGAVEVFMDLRKIKALEEELSRKEKLAALGQMAATMAHKIRNPLGGIAGFAGLLRLELGDNEAGTRLVGKITEGVDKLNRIVSSLLAYTAVLQIRTRPLQLSQLVESTYMGTAESPEDEDVRFIVEVPDEEVLVNADPDQLKTAFAHLLQNAVEAVDAAGSIEVAVLNGDSGHVPENTITRDLLASMRRESGLLKTGESCMIVLITDSGAGFSGETEKQLFVPFFTTKENGIGLGLSTSRKIIEAHRGELYIAGHERRGTCVGIVLPADPMM